MHGLKIEGPLYVIILLSCVPLSCLLDLKYGFHKMHTGADVCGGVLVTLLAILCGYVLIIPLCSDVNGYKLTV